MSLSRLLNWCVVALMLIAVVTIALPNQNTNAIEVSSYTNQAFTAVAARPNGKGYRASNSALIYSPIIGVWKGTIQVDPDYDNFTFSALLTIVDGEVGEIIGTIAHPSIRCGGEMRLQDATSNTIVTSSDYYYGNCLDGTHVLTLESEDSLRYEWRDPHSDRVDMGMLTKISTSGSAVPSGFLGIWSGTATQINPNSEWHALFGLVNGEVGSTVGTFASPTYSCGGELVLQSVENGTFELLHDITYGNCWDNGFDTLTVINDHSLDYHWRSPDETSTASGTLERLSGALYQSCILPNFGDENGNPLLQRGGVWADDPYGGYYTDVNGEKTLIPFIHYGNNADNIANWGCYLTSAAMIVNYYAERQGLTFRTDPGILNEWLQNYDGYNIGKTFYVDNQPHHVDSSYVKPWKVREYANSQGIQMAYEGRDIPSDDPQETVAAFMDRTTATVNADMCALNPMIMGVTGVNGQHFVAASGSLVEANIDTWQIHDPEISIPTSLNTEYNNTYNQIIRFSDGDPSRFLSIAIHSPVEVLITDSEGRKTGYDPTTGTLYEEIPRSVYGTESLAADNGVSAIIEHKVLEIVTANLGEYKVQVFGTGTGPYALEITAANNLGIGKTSLIEDVAWPGKIDFLTIIYEATSDQPLQITDAGIDLYLPQISK